MSEIQVELSVDKKRVTVMDNGRGIPAENAKGVYLHLSRQQSGYLASKT